MARFPMTKTLTRITVTGQDGEHQLQIEDGSGEVAVYHQIRADPSACRGSRRSARGGGRGQAKSYKSKSCGPPHAPSRGTPELDRKSPLDSGDPRSNSLSTLDQALHMPMPGGMPVEVLDEQWIAGTRRGLGHDPHSCGQPPSLGGRSPFLQCPSCPFLPSKAETSPTPDELLL